MAKNKNRRWFRAGNTARLSWKGHVFPVASISRFAVRNGTVQVWRKYTAKPVPMRPKNELFCALRGWDHRAEHGLMADIEREFQPIATAVLAGKDVLSEVENQAVTRFWYLWEERFTLKHAPQCAIQSRSLWPNVQPLTQEQQENLESNGYVFLADGGIPGPQAARVRLMMKLGPWLSRQPPMSWNVLRSEDLEFLVPDTFGGYRFVPIAPNCCLTTDVPSDSRLDRGSVRQINELALARSKQYAFAREWRVCFYSRGFQP